MASRCDPRPRASPRFGMAWLSVVARWSAFWGMDRWFTFLPSTECSGGSAAKVDRRSQVLGPKRKEDAFFGGEYQRTGSEGAPALIEGRRPDAPNPRLCSAKQARRSRNCRAPVRGCVFTAPEEGRGCAKRRMGRHIVAKTMVPLRKKSMKDGVRQGWCATKQRARASWA